MKNLTKILHRIYISLKKIKLKNKTFTIISSNCIGGVIYNDLGIKFLSPTINLFFYPTDFIKFVKNLEYYLNLELEKVNSTLNYPVGKLGDIKIYFMHYKSFEEAKITWNKRKKRVNFENLFVIMVDRDGCTYDDIEEFQTIKYNKIFLTNKCLHKKDVFTISGFEDMEHLGNIIDFDKKNKFHRYYEQFDFISFFNK